MIPGQTFDNFHEMYQRAMKIARVLEETKKEKEALDVGKRKMGPPRKGFPSNKRFRADNYQGKGNNLQNGELTPSARRVGNIMKGCVCLQNGVSSVENPSIKGGIAQ